MVLCRDPVVDFRSEKTNEGVGMRDGLSSKTVANLCVRWEAWSLISNLGVMTGFPFPAISEQKSLEEQDEGGLKKSQKAQLRWIYEEKGREKKETSADCCAVLKILQRLARNWM